MKFLWETKIKSRASFLMILELLRIKKDGLRSLLVHLSPDGQGFYERFVTKNYQFLGNELHSNASSTGLVKFFYLDTANLRSKVKMIFKNFNVASHDPLMTPSFSPSLPQILQLTQQELDKKHLLGFEWTIADSSVHHLSFIFTGTTVSPPASTYP